MDILERIGKTFWSTNVWLPPNTTWEDITPGSRPDVSHADYRDLIWPLPMAAVVMVLRYAVESIGTQARLQNYFVSIF
ncbi:ceramide synthase 4-like [Rhagoletis pomonella]|uniref:ceramide synthase 4-like n=1 Tax=Rhagoletis pomonella TaxID=28610 RepID=UPI00177F4BE8|nr:ceramide synthase 4-like [Rhagoletis pomonella]XP_036343295.1 ceramide synthase 4-like [Rhagoletis pomonella]